MKKKIVTLIFSCLNRPFEESFFLDMDGGMYSSCDEASDRLSSKSDGSVKNIIRPFLTFKIKISNYVTRGYRYVHGVVMFCSLSSHDFFHMWSDIFRCINTSSKRMFPILKKKYDT